MPDKPTPKTLKEQYKEYLYEVERQNFDIDMYDGDTYLPNIIPMTFKEFCDND